MQWKALKRSGNLYARNFLERPQKRTISKLGHHVPYIYTLIIQLLDYGCEQRQAKDWRHNTVCPRSLSQIFIVTHYINWVKTSWTDSTSCTNRQTQRNIETDSNTICPRILDPIFMVTYHIKWFKSSWTDSTSCTNRQTLKSFN